MVCTAVLKERVGEAIIRFDELDNHNSVWEGVGAAAAKMVHSLQVYGPIDCTLLTISSQSCHVGTLFE